MHEVNLAAVDLNLLPPLDALLRRRNVSHAAEDVGLSQPAMSRALGRLRDLLGDPLLVRGPGGYALTPLARELSPALAAAMADMKGLFRSRAFEPSQVRRLVRIVASDFHGVLLAPALLRRLAAEAPGVALRLEPYGPSLPERMSKGEIDLAFATTGVLLPPGAQSQVVGRDRLALVMRRGHPAEAEVLTLADYARFGHATVALFGDGQSSLDAQLAAVGVNRRIAFTAPGFIDALAAVAGSDLITTTSETFARRFAEPFGLTVRPAPLPDTAYELTLVWSNLQAGDELLAWLRGLVAEVAADVFGPGAWLPAA
jgi:DNA-binding transcriptional LysR family regulator